ncbi:WhiB family transcriptional regulator [Streptomyces sp. NPDC058548]|uniref:WhiB family transcriptional regulator n=1 Tax=unclassified Streptomyces TaxID=2593676 RepID=UPI003659D77B
MPLFPSQAARATETPAVVTRYQPGKVLPETEWMPRAACRFVDPELFFPSSPGPVGRRRRLPATKVCEGCPVRNPCLAQAVRVREPQGVWGGLTVDERQRLLVDAGRLNTLGRSEAAALLSGRHAKVRPNSRPAVVFRLLAAGWTEEEIADALRTSPDIVRLHRRTAETAAPYRRFARAETAPAPSRGLAPLDRAA